MVRARPSSSERDTPAVRVVDADGRNVAALAVMRLLDHQIGQQKSNRRYFQNGESNLPPVVLFWPLARKSLSHSHQRFSTYAAET
jgi:hypothetical protein